MPLKSGSSFILLIWPVLYFFSGEISFALHEPARLLPPVWLPSGIAVSSLLFTPAKRWLWIVLSLLLASLALSVVLHQSVMALLALTIVSLMSGLLITACVQFFTNIHFSQSAIFVWLIATLCTSVLLTIASKTIFDLTTPFSFMYDWRCWGTHVSAVVFITAVVSGWIHKTPRLKPSSPWLLLISMVTGLLSLMGCWYLFQQRLSARSDPLLPLVLMMLPVMMICILTVIWGSFAGSGALLCLGGIVLVASSRSLGPFTVNGEFAEDALLAAQGYLCAPALLILIITDFIPANPDRPE